jgi:hypothetical protein
MHIRSLLKRGRESETVVLLLCFVVLVVEIEGQVSLCVYQCLCLLLPDTRCKGSAGQGRRGSRAPSRLWRGRRLQLMVCLSVCVCVCAFVVLQTECDHPSRHGRGCRPRCRGRRRRRWGWRWGRRQASPPPPQIQPPETRTRRRWWRRWGRWRCSWWR